MCYHSVRSPGGALSREQSRGYYLPGHRKIQGDCDVTPHEWIISWQSEPRWQRYLQAGDGNTEHALKLYEWNLHLASSVMHDIAHFEVAIRNRYDQIISERWEGRNHWLFAPDSPINKPLIRKRKGKEYDINAPNRSNINSIKSRLRHTDLDPGRVIAELPFGFWRHLTDAAHEKTLWVCYLKYAFPKGTSRKWIEESMQLINVVRNRASHHEPLFNARRLNELTRSHAAILELADLISHPLARYIRLTSPVNLILERMPC